MKGELFMGNWKTLTGVLTLGLVITHLLIQHGEIASYEDLVAYLSHPINFSAEIILLTVVTTHVLIGVRAAVLKLGLSPSAERRLRQGLIIIGILIVGYGVGVNIILTD